MSQPLAVRRASSDFENFSEPKGSMTMRQATSRRRPSSARPMRSEGSSSPRQMYVTMLTLARARRMSRSITSKTALFSTSSRSLPGTNVPVSSSDSVPGSTAGGGAPDGRQPVPAITTSSTARCTL